MREKPLRPQTQPPLGRRLPPPPGLRSPRAFEGVLLVSIATLLLLGFALAPASGTPRGTGLSPAAMSGPTPADVVDYVNVTTTSYAFVPSQFTVTPGAAVHLIITQAATVPHTFVLSSVANFTFPSSDSTAQLYAYFHSHDPLENLSLSGTVGSRAYANFTAPPAGTFEFVCVIEGHFAAGMNGVMTSGVAPSTTAAIPWALIAGVVIALAAAAVVAYVVLRRRKTVPAPQPGAQDPPRA